VTAITKLSARLVRSGGYKLNSGWARNATARVRADGPKPSSGSTTSPCHPGGSDWGESEVHFARAVWTDLPESGHLDISIERCPKCPVRGSANVRNVRLDNVNTLILNTPDILGHTTMSEC
jgi:hypothetical protein